VAPLAIVNGTLGCGGTPVGNHCYRLMLNSMKTSFAQQIIFATSSANHMK